MSEHIRIGSDRYVIVPESLQKIGVQFDHNAETVTFDCPRYWDGHDLSKMTVYINYMRPNESFGTHICDNVVVDSSDDTIMHFDWTISGHVTEFAGPLSFLVCIRDVDSDGSVTTDWNSELSSQLYISSGMKCREAVLNRYPDIITQLLRRMGIVEDVATGVAANAAKAAESATRAAAIVDEVSGMTEAASLSASDAAEAATNAVNCVVQVTALVDEVSGMTEAASLSASDAAEAATNAETREANAANSALLAKSWAIGGTGLRADEAVNNAKYWCDNAKSVFLDADDLHAITVDTAVSYTSSCQNTPYPDVTPYASGICFVSYANENYITLVAIPSGTRDIFIQTKRDAWSEWSKVTNNNDSIDCGTW